MPALNMTKSGVILRSGDSMLATITYNGKKLTLNLLDPVNNKTYTFSKAINIPEIVGGKTAYVGFTGSTGLAHSHIIIVLQIASPCQSPGWPPPQIDSLKVTCI